MTITPEDMHRTSDGHEVFLPSDIWSQVEPFWPRRGTPTQKNAAFFISDANDGGQLPDCIDKRRLPQIQIYEPKKTDPSVIIVLPTGQVDIK